jgi:flagellar assembly protein FliH
MQAGEKFLFDLNFDDLDILKEISEQEVEIDEGAESEDAEPEEEIITFTEEEMNSQRKLALEEGKQQGVSETLDGIENNIADVFTKIDETISGLFKIQREENERTRKEAISVALAIVEKLFSSLDREHGFDEVIKMTEDTLEGLLREPAITIYVNGAYADSMDERLKEFLGRRDFQGNVHVTGDTELAAGDCRIEWATGSGKRSSAMILEAAQDVIANNLNSELLAPNELPEPDETALPEIIDQPEQPQELPADDTVENDINNISPEPLSEVNTDMPADASPDEAEIKDEESPETIDTGGPQAETEAPADGEATDNLAAQMEQKMPPGETPVNGDQSSN